MAEPPYNPSNPGDAAAKLGPERARQGQNIKGMIWVLGIGIALVVIAYMVLITLSAQPVTPDNRPILENGAAAEAPIAPPPAEIPPQ